MNATACFGAWFTETEALQIRRAAARVGMEPSEWLRVQALAAARHGRDVTEEMMRWAPADPVTALKSGLPGSIGSATRGEETP